ncbi:MAG: transporter substrate-binding domain-containing protein [Treponema sp.]|nr:transporter substrate-binding domain-containing protein [Treponema sp.]
MKKIKFLFPVILLINVCIAMSWLTGCSREQKDTSVDYSAIQSFRDIPGVTVQEIAAIEALQKERNSLVYAMALSTEAFFNKNGSENGYGALLCEWLTKIFGIKFIHRILDWSDLDQKLHSGEIDFAIHQMFSGRDPDSYYMTDPIAQRTFMVIRLAGSRSIDQIAQERNPRYVFIQSSPTEVSIAATTRQDSFESVQVETYDEAFAALDSGHADGFITAGVTDANFINYDSNSYITEDYYPLTFTPVRLSTEKPELEVIISVLNKALRNGAISFLNSLYNKGDNEYRQYKFSLLLDEEEEAYIKNNPFVPLAVQYFNYPIVFYDNYEKKWDGITFDLLHEVENITGLKFEVINGINTEMRDLIQMLSDGRAHIFSDLVFSHQREGLFIWANQKLMSDQYALLSKNNFPNVNINEIPLTHIALIENTAHAEMFRTWFPNAVYVKEYPSADEAFLALEHGDVDMVMASRSKLLYYSNYFEFSGYKANYLFNYYYDSAFAYNRDKTILRSIIDKTLSVIDVEIIAEQWLTKTYDYRAQIIEARFPWMVGAIMLAMLVIALILIIFIRSKRQAIKLQKEHERTRVMLDTLPIACFMGSGDGRIYDCNNEAVRLFELKDKQDFINRFKTELSPEYQPDGKNSQEETYKHGIEAFEKGNCVFNWMHKLPDGTPVPALVTLESVIYDNEKIVIAYVRDMREHVQMTNTLDRQNELLKIVNSVSSSLLEPDIDHFEDTLRRSMGIIAEVSGVDRICIWKNAKDSHWLRFSLIYQWEKDNFSSQAKDGVLVPDIWLSDHPVWNETMSQGNCVNALISDMSPGEQAELASRNILSILAIPVFLQNHFWGFVGFDHCKIEELFKDDDVLILRSASRMMANAVIRNEMAGELVFAKEQAEQSNHSKSIFLSHMSHEIRTPMNAILGIAEIQLREENNTPDTQEAFGKIYESGDLLLNIINDILDLSKIESGKLELTLGRYDIPSLINDTVQLCRLRYDSKPIEFLLHIDGNTPVDLLGDELRIKQVLNNILSNAFKYTDKGTIDFFISAESVGDNSGENVILVFKISDTGQGMTENQLSRIFEEYIRFNMAKNRTTVGAGLGMSITKRLVDLMDGTINIASEKDKGSVFTVRLPQKRIGNAVCGQELTEKLQNFNFHNTTIIKKTRFMREYMPYGSVLIVDDVDSNIYVTKGMLAPYGLNIDTVMSGFAAIEKIKDGNIYDIVFMDHMMPKMDGIEATKILREMGYKNTIIALTANALVGRAEMFMRNGFDGFISKPIDSRELNLFLNDFIRNKQPLKVIEAARREQEKRNLFNANTTNQGFNAQDTARSPEMAELFVLDAENAINIMDDFIKKYDNPGTFNEVSGKDDLNLYIVTVHGIKSTLANLGEKELSASAFKLEQAGEERDLNAILNTTPGFTGALKSMIEKYKPQQKNSNTEITEEDKILLQGNLRSIQTACAAFDKENAKTALKELKQKTWPAEINAVLDEITINLLHSSFKKTVSVIKDFLSK